MICPSCKKSGPAGFKCRSCGAELMRGRYRAEDPNKSGGPATPVFRAPAHAAAGVAGAAAAVDNPYATPRTVGPPEYHEAGSSDVLASRGARLAAALIDGLAVLVLLLPALAAVFLAGPDSNVSALAGLLAAGSVLAFLAFAIYQILMLCREGQTLGKKMMNIRIVNYDDGLVPSAGRILGMRVMVNAVLGNIIPLYGIVDALFIFGNEQRCLHDYLAGTKVVEV